MGGARGRSWIFQADRVPKLELGNEVFDDQIAKKTPV
jgi:hypothetical protein